MKFAALAALAAPLMISAAAAQAPAAEILELPRFDAIELNGGGNVIVRHGPAQQVRLLKGSSAISGFEVTSRGRGSGDRRLVIDACKRSCNGRYDLVVEIVTPKVEAVAIHGGGRIETREGFPGQTDLAAAIEGGGVIDTRALAARDVAASVSGGGRILTRASASLAASINSGGEIRYWGDPQVATSVNGGGAVTRGR